MDLENDLSGSVSFGSPTAPAPHTHARRTLRTPARLLHCRSSPHTAHVTLPAAGKQVAGVHG